jgi:nucleoid-associated protein YgaU
VTRTSAEAELPIGILDWPVQCPVDLRWLTDLDTCPDCGSLTAPLRALNDLARSLLNQAEASNDPETAGSLVSQAAMLVPSTERFEEAAADALERAGRPDLALERVEAALQIAPRRPDLLERAAALRARPAGRQAPSARSAAWGRFAIAAVVLLAFGAIGGGLLSRSIAPPDVPGVTAVPTSAGFASASQGAETPSAASTPDATPVPSSSARPSASPEPAQLVRAALSADRILAEASLAVEQIGATVRISGPVADATAYARLEAVVRNVTAGVTVDLTGVTFPHPRYVYVQPGDTLWSIAARTYGNPRRWGAIAAANPGVDPSNLRSGQRLVVP